MSQPSLHLEFVTDSYAPDVNGAARTLAHLVRELRLLGNKVTVTRTGEDPQEDEQIVFFQPLPRYEEIKIAFVTSYTLAEKWRKSRPDCIYIGMESPMGCAAMRAAHSLDIPVIAGFHTNFHQYCKSFKINFLTPLILRHIRNFHNAATATVVPSPSVLEELTQLNFERLHVMGRGVDTKLFHPKKRCESLRKKWGASADTPVAIYVGRMSPEKNLELVAESFYSMQKQCPEVRCVVVGDGPALKEFKQKHPSFLCFGYLHGEELAQAYASADIMVFPSISETFGNTVTEAMASGLLIVAYNYASAQMHLKHEVSALLAPFDNRLIFLDLIAESLTCWQKKFLREQARTSVESLSWRSIAQRLLHIIKTM